MIFLFQVSPGDNVVGSTVSTSTLKDNLQDLNTNSTHSLLFRATDGNSNKNNKVKFTTVVSADDIENFWIKYTEVIKGGMTGLKKKDKKKKQKAKKAKKQSGDDS